MSHEPFAPVTPPGSVAPARVLIADDDTTMCNFCARALALAGFATLSANTADEAIVALRERGPFDLLLADVQMPGKSGLELAGIAREIDPAMAVVIITGHATAETLHGAARRGVADFLAKPFELEELQEVVETALRRRRQLQDSLRLRAIEELMHSSEAINAILDRDQLASEIIRRAVGHVPCQAGFLLVAGRSDTPTLVVAEPPGATLLPGGRDAVANSFREGRALVVGERGPLSAVEGRELTVGIAVPLRAQTETVGALLICDDQPTLDSSGAVELLSLLANQAGNALRNAHLYGELDTAYKGLRQLDQLKSEFISIASHELRSPLSIVMGYAKMVRDRSQGEPRDYSQKVLEGAEKIKEIVDDLVRLRDFDRNQSQLTIERADLGDVMRQAVDRLEPAAQQKHQTIAVNGSEQSLLVSLDREKSLLVIGNLLSNAIKFTPQGGRVSIGLTLWPNTALTQAVGRAATNPTVRHLSGVLPANWAVVSIEDTGIGIPRDQQAKIFERFYQVASSLTREQGGVGLGLSIVCDLATLQGGVVWLESEEGRGSTFYFGLPLAEAAAL